MKISVYGAGNQNLYVNKLNLPKNYGGEPPYGGSRMAMEFAEAGHDVILAEPNKNILTEEMWKKVEESGVKVVSDDIEAAKHGEICIFFTPFGKRTIEIAKNILPHLPENGIIANTCTISPVVLYTALEVQLRTKRKDVGISSMHPAAVPGTPQHSHYVISGASTDGTHYATEEQIKKCVELAESANKKAYVVPADVSSTVAGIDPCFGAIMVAGVIDACKLNKRFKLPEGVFNEALLDSVRAIKNVIKEYEKISINTLSIEKFLEQIAYNLPKNIDSTLSSNLSSPDAIITHYFAIITSAGLINACKFSSKLGVSEYTIRENIINTFEELDYLINRNSIDKILEQIPMDILAKSARYYIMNDEYDNNGIVYSALKTLKNYKI
ncbi:H(2)-dependent methylenetetrahydromethanopterin dehydrogenase-related protein [Methanothermococcus okinawensis]|uniref:Coenzyme F420-dependent N(5),N(10)-methenyltetrahydromethanopterin reductase-related protein n=1 Tax=Methanothermococcus okinawensis (strain DSM 14208 / JCM 11175 / IH1) TaxID=647113 RepID=F8ALP9_METOI|nr:H(2)-dependent methylenetetrahydromethanopterin dehydrogenase-related protein [Methanothermococcus okinawensis]AEH06597.1 coenzyme F420-dependent N(5),N(10)-methenyltetrahydromethanopterin reductase-related protein [Methanothermococcus okinawensis IH1]